MVFWIHLSRFGLNAKMDCREALRLFDIYEEALIEFHAVRLGLPDAGTYEYRFARVSEARKQYLEHLETHGCRRATLRTDQADLEERLGEEMRRARAIWQQALREYKRLLDLSEDIGLNCDGRLALKQAVRLQRETMSVYKFTFQRYLDYLQRNLLPDDLNN